MNSIFALILSVIMSLGTYSNMDKVDDNTCNIENNMYRTYINENLGFSLEIPSEWEGYYNIVENAQGIIFMFCGESDACTQYNESGLLMFYIVNDEEVNSEALDSIRKIGTVQGISYYYATSTDVSLAPIMLVNDSLINDALEKYGEEQTEIMKKDWEKVQEMQEDIPNLLQSFREL